MAERPVIARDTGFNAAIDNLTEGLSRLVRKHFELARTEVRQEVSEISHYVGLLAVLAGVGLVGYGLLNLAIILFAAWLGDVAVTAFVALGLALANLGAAAIAGVRMLRTLRQNHVQLPQTTDEMQRNKQWLKEIRASSSPNLPAETN